MGKKKEESHICVICKKRIGDYFEYYFASRRVDKDVYLLGGLLEEKNRKRSDCFAYEKRHGYVCKRCRKSVRKLPFFISLAVGIMALSSLFIFDVYLKSRVFLTVLLLFISITSAILCVASALPMSGSDKLVAYVKKHENFAYMVYFTPKEMSKLR